MGSGAPELSRPSDNFFSLPSAQGRPATLRRGTGAARLGFSVGLRIAQSDLGFSGRSIRTRANHYYQPAGLVIGDVADQIRSQLRRIDRNAGADGIERSLLHPGRARPDRGLPFQRQAVSG